MQFNGGGRRSAAVLLLCTLTSGLSAAVCATAEEASRVRHRTGMWQCGCSLRLRVVALTIAPRRCCAQLPAVLTLQTAAPS